MDIRPVPAPERNLRGIDFFLLWAGVAISLGGPDRLRHPAVGAVDRFFIGARFIPLFGVVLTDYFILRRRRLDIADIYREGGQYWYRKGFNPAAIIAWAAGFAVYEAMAVLTLPVGGSLPSMFTAGIIYWVFARAGKTAS